MHERRVNIFYGHLVTCGKKKTMKSIFYWLAERAVIIFCPEKSIGALIGEGHLNR